MIIKLYELFSMCKVVDIKINKYKTLKVKWNIKRIYYYNINFYSKCWNYIFVVWECISID